MWRVLKVNTSRGGMKRLMEEVAAQHAKTVHYSASIGIRVGGENSKVTKDTGFCLVALQSFFGKKRVKEEADCAKRRVQEVTGWNDPVEGKAKGAGPSNQ